MYTFISPLTFADNKSKVMGRTPKQILQLLDQQDHSGLSVAKFCDQQQLNRGTFYAWRTKYNASPQTAQTGFTQLVATPFRTSTLTAVLHLDGEARLELTDWSVDQLAAFTRQLLDHD